MDLTGASYRRHSSVAGLARAAGRGRIGVFEHLAIEVKELEGSRVLLLHPSDQGLDQLLGVDLIEGTLEGVVAWHLVLAMAFWDRPAAQATALAMPIRVVDTTGSAIPEDDLFAGLRTGA